VGTSTPERARMHSHISAFRRPSLPADAVCMMIRHGFMDAGLPSSSAIAGESSTVLKRLPPSCSLLKRRVKVG
jgi:hypothetical protein